MEESGKIPMTAVDRIADGNGLQMMKAAIPYLPSSLQRSLSVYIKMMEMNNVITYYNNPIHACSAPSDASDPEALLNDLRNYGNDSQRQSLDQILNLMHTLKMYQEYKDLF